MSLEAVETEAACLTPIQLCYTSAAWSLPIRLGTLNSPGSCDPCPPGGAPKTADLQAVGFVGEAYQAHFTRIRMRYAPDQVDQDLVLYSKGGWAQSQVRYIDYDHQLEDRFPICGTGWASTPGSCSDNSSRRQGRSVAAAGPENKRWSLGGLWAVLMGGVVLLGKRRVE